MTAKTHKRSFGRKLWLQRGLILMSVPLLLHRILFSYVPLAGWTIAFQDFRPRFGLSPIQQILQNEFVGLDNFKRLLDGASIIGERFLLSVRNTIGQSLLTLVLGYVCAITLSLLLNEITKSIPKKIIQNILYLPHFLSWVIVAGLASTALAMPGSGGIINEILMSVGILKEPIHFLANPNSFWNVVAGTHLWKTLGWNTIIYLAAMTTIDPTLYEAAAIDGANRYQKMWHVTLPCIRPTIIILLIMSTGWLLTSGFEIQWFLGNGLNVTHSENIDIFVLRYGIEMNNFGLATAAGIFRTGVSIFLLTMVNFIAGRLGQEKLF
ncbi:MAG: ABC transporter permease subunit [Clostridiales bacterium]|nr:ABC transporter permease subunit [Clostridiales bacterium]